MSWETLAIIWFVLIAVLWIGYFVLEGFDFGVGILLPFVAKDEAERRTVVSTLGPVWDGNEVWLLTAGGATFAAFPLWYATLFSGFYLALLLILVALIVRGVAFEFRSKRGTLQPDLAQPLGLGDHLRLVRAGPALGRRVRQHRQGQCRWRSRTATASSPATCSRCSTRTACSAAW